MNRIVYQVLKILPDVMYIRLQYWYLTKRRLNLKKPTRYNEKLQWIKLYDRKPEYTTFVDKYLVKQYVAAKVGSEYIIPTIGVWNNAAEIEIESLPNQFVMKCNHDSKSVFICRNKTEFDFDAAINVLNKAVKRNHFTYGREWPYKNVRPVIIAEQYMEDESGGLQDYKVLCFNGIPKLIQLHQGRFTNKYTQDIYDVNWVRQDFNQRGEVMSDEVREKPVFLKEMLDLSAILSQGIPHIRVDWYYVDHHLYFGELTFFDAAGYLEFEPDKYNEIIGEWIELPNKETSYEKSSIK
ncbi:MAG: ATP-grasp fold amidoligase family protein [Lachnospiraceae bacterium]|nr:ATP-grasp fold amidoligase family protein [Lachnospiraceae bacterium]